MPLESLLILVATHGLPIFLFAFMSIDILLRNHRNVEHVLVACLCIVYFLMFVGELIRNLAHIDYSPLISSIWFSSLGLLTLSITLHYIMRISKLATKLPKWLNPYIFYLPVIPILLNIITGAQLFSTQTFEQHGMWIFPIYNTNYYMTMAGSVFVNFLIIIPLFFMYKKASKDQQSIYKSLINMFLLVAICNPILGFVPFPEFVPPYPYLYSGLIFCFYLRKIMQDTEFLQQYDKRYEKLFVMNPDAIFLIDTHFNIRELNPVAQAFIDRHGLKVSELTSLLPIKIKKTILKHKSVRNIELSLTVKGVNYDLLLNIDHVTIELEQHHIIIFRNISALKEQQREIEFLAYHDALTKLPNRRYFYEKIDGVLQDASANGDIITIFVLDLNNLKMLNDLRGHEAGDLSIQMLANVLKAAVGQFGIVSRVGGDEFIASLNETKSGYTPEAFIEHILTEYAKELAIFDNIPVGTSIGYSQFPHDNENIDALIKLADESMYEMKKLKKVQYR